MYVAKREWPTSAVDVISVLCGIGVAASHVVLRGVSPVGTLPADLAWTSLLGVIAGLTVSRVPAWLSLLGSFALLAVVGTTASATTALIAVAVAAWAIDRSSWSTSIAHALKDEPTPLRVGAAAGSSASLLNSSLWLQDHGVQFLSTGASALLWTVLLTTALAQGARRPTWKVIGLAATAVVVAILAGVGMAADFRTSYIAATEAEREARVLIDAARAGDFELAEASFERSRNAFETMNAPLESRTLRMLGHVPIAGPNLKAVEGLLIPLSEMLTTADAALHSSQDLDSLVDSGSVDVAHLAGLAEYGDAALDQVSALHTNLTGQRNVWVVPQLGHRLDAVAKQVAPLTDISEVSLANGVRDLLGSTEQRSYLLVFGNTAEARELGGFAGGTALVRIEDGRISLGRADRPNLLNENPASLGNLSEGPPQRFLEHRPWRYSQNFTAMADFPTLARTLGDLYPVMSGSEVDGVAYIDSAALAALVGLVGEVHLDEANRTIRADEVDHLVTVSQYELNFESREEREDFLGELVEAIFQAMFSEGTKLDPMNFQPVVDAIREDRLMFVPFDQNQFQTTQAIGLVGGIERTAGQDYLAVSHLNGGPNKLDPYLHRTVEYDATVDPLTGQLDATVTITLRNDTPLGLSEYAAGNEHDYPMGTNRAFVVVHTPHDAVTWAGNEDELELTRSWTEFGLQRHEQVVVVPRGQSKTVTLQLSGSVTPGDYHIDIGHQPLANDDDLTISVEPTIGRLGESGRDFQARFTLERDTDLQAAWVPASTQPVARSVGGGE